MTIANHDVFMSDSLSDLISIKKEEERKLDKFEAMINFHGKKMFFNIVEFENMSLTLVVPRDIFYNISSMYDFNHMLQFDIGQGTINSFIQTYKTKRILKATRNANETWTVTIEFGDTNE